jgi:hypothetical protein
MLKTFELQRFDSGMHFILLDERTAQQILTSNTKRVLCTLNKTITFHGALMPKKEGGFYINIGKTICKQLGLKVGQTVTAVFEQDDTEHQFELPEELAEVLATDPEAKEKFNALTPGNKRSLMYLVAQVKSTDKRIERALTIAAKLKIGIHSPKLILKY